MREILRVCCENVVKALRKYLVSVADIFRGCCRYCSETFGKWEEYLCCNVGLLSYLCGAPSALCAVVLFYRAIWGILVIRP